VHHRRGLRGDDLVPFAVDLGQLAPVRDALIERGQEFLVGGELPGGGEEGSFYAYAYPEPEGFAAWNVEPAAAYYDPTLREFLLPYTAVRTASDPDATLLSFLQSTYEAAAELGRWDRAALEVPRSWSKRTPDVRRSQSGAR